MIFSDKFYFTDIYYCIILCSGPKGNLVMFSVLPSLLITMMSCSLNVMIIMVIMIIMITRPGVD